MPAKKELLLFTVFIGLFLPLHHCLAKAEPAPVCYGQLKPICGLNQKPVCICAGNIGQNCSYICM